MSDKIIINEKALLHRLECPLRSNASSAVPESPVLACSENTARWQIAERAGGRAPSAATTREVFDAEWKGTPYFQSRTGIPAKEYETRVREGIRACRRLRDIIFRCEVIQPLSPYALPIGDAVITGEYAVFRSSRRKNHASPSTCGTRESGSSVWCQTSSRLPAGWISAIVGSTR
jgi:hypothetical protein